MGSIQPATTKHLRGKLLSQGLTLDDFAKSNGFKPNTVAQVIKRYWGKSEVSIRGKVSKMIILKLQDTIG